MIWFFYAVIVSAVVTSLVIASRRKSNFVTETRYEPPVKIERNDFPQLNNETLVVSFTSRVCDSCSNVMEKVKVLESDSVGIANIEFEDVQGKQLHTKYQIEAVPTTLICDENGVVSQSYVGPVSATDLWASVARSRGAQIQGCDDHNLDD